MTQRQKDRISLALLGKPKSEEFKEKCRKRMKGKPSPMKGKKQTAKHREAMTKISGKNHYNYKDRAYGKMTKSQYSVMLRREKNGFVDGLFERRLKEQDNKCAICEQEFNEEVYMLKKSADHCHARNSPRGILCRKCNIMLGNANDDVKILEGAIKYLHKWGT